METRMHRHWILPCTFLAVLGAAGAAWAEEPADPQAVIDKAVKAMGGADKLAKYHAVTGKGKGTFSGLGQTVACTVAGVAQLPRQRRMEIDFEFLGANIGYLQVLDGAHGWLRIRGNTDDMDKEQLTAAQEEAYAEWVVSLVPLLKKGGAFTLTALKETEVKGQPAVGVKVASRGHHDVELYFDKDSGLLVKSKSHGRDLRSGNEFEQEAFYRDYKPFEGVQRATRRLVKRDGKEFLNIEFTEVKLLEKAADKDFAKPED
jgi:hypothetical protein